MTAIQAKQTVQPSRREHFMLTFVCGICTGIALFLLVWLFHLRPLYMSALDEFSGYASNFAGKAQACTNAYIASHDGQLPDGTKTEGTGKQLLIVGYQH